MVAGPDYKKLAQEHCIAEKFYEMRLVAPTEPPEGRHTLVKKGVAQNLENQK